MDVTKEQVLKAIRKAAEGHSNKEEVERMTANSETYADMVLASIASGEYRRHIQYRRLTKVNPNGKTRHIESPMLFTFVLQHLFLVLAKPLYEPHDNLNAINCKPGCGITASQSPPPSSTESSTWSMTVATSTIASSSTSANAMSTSARRHSARRCGS